MRNRKTLKQTVKDWWEDYRAAVYIGTALFTIVFMVEYNKQSKVKHETEINKQVEEYEKSLPGYLEQKQRVEHYRDSLMRAKNR